MTRADAAFRTYLDESHAKRLWFWLRGGGSFKHAPDGAAPLSASAHTRCEGHPTSPGNDNHELAGSAADHARLVWQRPKSRALAWSEPIWPPINRPAPVAF